MEPCSLESGGVRADTIEQYSALMKVREYHTRSWCDDTGSWVPLTHCTVIGQ